MSGYGLLHTTESSVTKGVSIDAENAQYWSVSIAKVAFLTVGQITFLALLTSCAVSTLAQIPWVFIYTHCSIEAVVAIFKTLVDINITALSSVAIVTRTTVPAKHVCAVSSDTGTSEGTLVNVLRALTATEAWQAVAITTLNQVGGASILTTEITHCGGGRGQKQCIHALVYVLQ